MSPPSSSRRQYGEAPSKGGLLQGTPNLKDTVLNPSMALTKSIVSFTVPNILGRLGDVPMHPFTSSIIFSALWSVAQRKNTQKI